MRQVDRLKTKHRVMKTVSFLFLDHKAQKHQIQQSVCDLENLSLLDYVEKIKQREAGYLSLQINSTIDAGAVLSYLLLEEFVLYHININTSDSILISEFPKSYDQFVSFIQKLQGVNRIVNTVFYVKQRDPDKYIKDYFSNPENNAWLHKYGDEVILKWQEEYNKKRAMIDKLIIEYNTLIWRIIEVDYCVNIKEDCISSQLAKGLQ